MIPKSDFHILTASSPRTLEFSSIDPTSNNNVVSTDFWWRVTAVQLLMIDQPFSEWKLFPWIKLLTGLQYELYIHASQLIVPGLPMVPLHFVVPHKQNMSFGAFTPGPDGLNGKVLDTPLGLRFTWEPIEVNRDAWLALRSSQA